VRELQGRKESLHALAFTADNRFLVTGGTACRVDAWDLTDPAAKRPVFPKMHRTVGELWLSPDGTEIVAADLSPCTVARLRLDDPRSRNPFVPNEGISQAAPRITPTGTGVVAGSIPTRWEFAAGPKPVWQIPSTPNGQWWATDYAITPDGRVLAAGEAFHPNRYTVTGRRVAVHELDRVGAPRVFGTVSGFVKRLAWAPTGAFLAAAVETRILVWAANGTQVGEFQTSGSKHVIDVCFHPSGRWLAVADNSGAVRLLETATWTEARCFTWGLTKARSIAFSPDGTLAAVGSDTGKIVVWDMDV
jgi:WD40 repeat protein